MSEELTTRRIERQMKDAEFAPGYHSYVEFGMSSEGAAKGIQALVDAMPSINEWVQHQVSEGREVMEHEQHTGKRRMRPLRPDDV